MKRKSTFLRMFALLALLLPWTLQAQNAKVSEYDGAAATAAYTSIAGTSGATAWTQGAYVDVSMPFAMYFGENQIAAGSTLRVYPDGSASFASLAGSRIAPLYYAAGYTTTATSIYTKSSAQQLVVEWRKVVSDQNSYSFQLKLYPGGDIEFCYGPMSISSSINVLVGMMSSSEDIYRVGGANGTNDWSDITRYTSGTTTRALSSAYSPAYNTTTGQGVVYTFTQPACVKPSTLVAEALSSSSVKLDWTVNAAGVKYEIRYSTDPDFNPAEGEGTLMTVTSGTATTATVTGLESFTTYYFALRKFCDANTPSGWIEASAQTLCSPYAAADLPVVEDFDSYSTGSSATIHPCWTKVYGYNGSHTNYPYPSSSNYHSGNRSLYFYSSSTASYRSWIAIPYSGAMNNIAVNLWMMKTSASYGKLQVGVMTDPDDYSTFALIGDISINSAEYNTYTWYNQEVYFDAYTGNAGYIVILAPSGATNYVYVDDITISTLPACRRISDLQVTPTGLVTWSPVSGATFEVKYATADFDPTVEGTATTVTTNSFQVPSPAASTTYYVYVRNVCGDFWKKVTFTTPLMPPFVQDFSSSTFPPSGWNRYTGLINQAFEGTNPTSTTSGWSRNTSSYGLGSSQPNVRGNIYGTTWKYWLTTPNVYIPSANYNLSFDIALTGYSSSGNSAAQTTGTDDRFVVLVSTDGGNTWSQTNVLREWNNSGSTYVYNDISRYGESVEISLAAYAGQNVMIAFYGESQTSNADNYFYFDNVLIDIVRNCAKPTNLAATNITGSGATLTWTENTSTPSTQWLVKFSNDTFDPSTDEVDSVIVNTNPTYNITGLTPGTTYYFAVKSMCSNDDQSLWSSVMSFTTSFGVPFSEDFTASTFPPTGWSRLTGLVDNAFSGTNPTSYSSGWLRATTNYGLSTQPFARGNIYGSGWRHWLVTPNISIDVNAALSFDIALTGYSSSGNSAAQTSGSDDRFVVLVSTDNGSTWSASNVLREWNNSGSEYVYNDISRYGTHVIIPLTAYQGQSVMIAFYGESQTSNADNYFYIDNVSIDQVISCYPVTNVAASNITATTADLSWNDNNGTPDSWTVIYGAPGFDPATAGTSVTATTNHFTLTGLTEQTSYDVYVRANCVTGSDVSELSSVCSFATTCTNPCYDSIYMSDSYGDGWEGHTIDLYVNGALSAQYTLLDGYEGSAIVPMCPNDQIQLVWHQNGGSMYGENSFEIYNHDEELIYSCEDEAGLSNGIVLWQGRSCFTPNCHTPNNLTVSNITYSSATLDWTETTTPAPTQWVLGYMGENDADVTYIAINTKPYTLTGLTAETNYGFMVRAVCEPGVDSSDWSIASYFYTGYCQPAPSSVDNGGMAQVAFGDLMVVNTDTTAGLVYGNFSNLIGDGGQATDVAVSITYQTGYTYGTHIWVDWNNDLDFDDDGELVYTGLSESSNPTTLNASFTIPAGTPLGDYRMRIGGSDDDDGPTACYTGTYACLFDFTLRVTPAPTCYKPTGFTASNVYGKQATLSWNENTPTAANKWQICYTANGETTYIYVNTNNNYLLTGLTPETEYTDVMVRSICGAGDTSVWSLPISFTTTEACMVPTSLAGTATINSATLSWTENTLPTAATRWEVAYAKGAGLNPVDNESDFTFVETTNNVSFEVTGLSHSSDYVFYVRALCGADGYSEWSNVRALSTICGPWTAEELPIFEDFEAYSSGLPNCWEHIGVGTGQAYSNTTLTGARILRFSGAAANNIVTLPAINDTEDTLIFAFYTRPESFTNTNCGKFDVGYVIDKTDTSSFVALATYAYNDFTVAEQKEVMLVNFPAGAFPAFRHRANSTSWYWYVDDVTVKVLERTNPLADNGQTVEACNEYVMPDTTNGGYHGNLNATYVVRPAEAGKVAHLTGSYNLENGYDFLNVYRGAANANNLVGRYTGNGSIDYVTTSNLWADSGYFTLVLTTDADNAFAGMEGFKLKVSCECPQPAAETVAEIQEVNGTYTWRNGTTYNNNVVRTGLTYDATAAGVVEPDLLKEVGYTYTNVAGCDSVSYSLNLTVHPTYSLTYNAQICERDTFLFYGQKYATTGIYTVSLTSQYGADSIGILNLQVNPAPLAYIYSNNRQVSAIDAYCDGVDLALEARSNNSSATFEWEDESTAASRIVNPHESNTYTVTAVNPTTSCTSLPATLTVTTVPVPELSISGDAEICYGESTTLTLADANNVEATYRWSNGATGTSITVNPTATTTYTVTATTSNASACTATASLEVVVNALPVVAASASVGEICRDSIVTLTATQVEGYSYSWNTGAATAVATTAATNTGVYTVTVTDQNGCQNEFQTSTVTVYPSYELTDSLLVCYTNNPYTWGEQTITANGNYDQNFTIAHGCDSLVHLSFTFEQMGVQNSNRELCEGTVFTFGDGIYQQSYTASESTVITYIDTTSGDCPVQMNLNLTVNHPTATAIENTVCDSYTWAVSGQTYTESGAYPYTLATTKGCDSVVTLNLTVNYQNTGVETVTACDNYVWDLNGVNYTATTNEPTFTLQNQWGCDSVVTLDLTVNYRSYHEDFHCVRDAANFTWIDGETYNLDVNVTDGIEYVTGENADGCNEIAQLHLVLNPIINTLNWITVDTCDEYEIPNAVVFDDENDCQGHIEPLFISESGDYEVRTRPDANVYGQDELTRVHLTINRSVYHTTVATECLPFEWMVNVGTEEAPVMYSVATITEEMVAGAPVYNMSYEMPQQYSNGCSRIEVLRLTPKYPTIEVTDVVAICQNGSWTADNSTTFYGSMLDLGENILTWDNSGVNADGCQMTKQVALTVNPVYNETAELTFCESEFALNAETGEYELTIADANHDGAEVVLTIPGALNEVAYNNTVDANWQTALGCDSIVTIEYTVNPTTTETEVYTVCYKDNFVWDANGETYSKAGEYVDTVLVADTTTGCELYRVLNLTVHGTYEYFDTISVCTTYEGPDGVTYRETRTFDVPYEGTFDENQYCDAITHRTYKVLQNTLTEHFVLTNADYTWMNGTTYTESTDNVYYDAPVASGDCDDVHLLHLTMVDPIAICENALPYTVTYGNSTFTIPADAADNGTLGNGVDTMLYFTVLRNTTSNVAQTACDSYTWTNGNGETYTESGAYVYTTTNAAGCDSTVTLTLTVNASTAETVTVAACDSYTWTNGDGQTYTTSGNYTWTTTNKAGCDSVVTLALTVNTNAGVELTQTACGSYTWDRTGLTYTNSTNAPVVNDYTVTFTDANGCSGDSVLHLTLNPVNETNSDLVVNEAGSYTYLDVMYTAPYDGTIDHTFQNQYGCDSIDHLHLIIPIVADDQIVEVNVEACGSYTWEAPDGTGHTYEWMSLADRQNHGMAMYKDVTANQYVYTYPTDTTFDANGAMTAVRVLHLNLLEATYSTEILNIPASLGTYTIDGDPDDVTITFNLDSVGTPIVRTLGVGSVAFCNDYRTYTINIIDNYDTTEVYACADEASYTWNEMDYTIGEPGHTYWFSQVENAGTLNELVHVLKVNQRAVNAATATATACDSYTWTDGDSQTYTTSGVYVYNYTDDNQCAASMTLNLTVNYNSNSAFTDAACDTYTWSRNNQTYTASGDYTYSYNTAEGCASTDTLHLTINNNSNQSFTQAACNSYVWAAAEGGNDQTYTTSGTYTYNYTATNGCPSVNTLNLTINLPTNAAETIVACDSTEWKGTMYYTSGDYNYDYTSAAGCASTDVLHLTINNATHNSETVVQCDSYEWNGQTYTASGDYVYNYTNAANCPSVDTLHLTINVNTSTINDTIVACDEYTWSVNDRLYNATGNYTARTTDGNGCATTNTLTLTVNHSSSYDSVLYISDGSYRYTYQDQHQELFGEGVYNLTEMYTNAAGCDSTLNITLNIGTALLGIDNVVNCNSYTWRNGETYVYIDATERAANLNADNVAPLYKTSNGVYVYYNPTYTVAQENNYDSIYMLALTLTQSYLGNDEVTLNISDRQLTYGNTTFAFDTLAVLQQNFVSTDKEFDVHFPAVQYCDSIITLTIHLVNNYQAVTAENADICVSQDSYTWRNHTISTATTDFDNAHTYYIYDTLATGIIEYITVKQHPITYATERRTACDSYTWYGTEYTESTSNATMYLPAGTEVDGETLICDKVVTLILTINHNTNTTYDVPACESYIWTAANGGNGDTLTESGTYTYDYLTAAGCPSTNTLNLTINHNTSTEYTVDACDSYTWTTEEGGNGTVYTTSSPAEGYTYDYLTVDGCPSTNTLHLTIRNNSNQSFTKTACDTYTWLAAEGGNGETYTTSGVYTYDYEAANGCPSTNTLNLTVNNNSSTEYTVASCDSYTWHGTEYTVSGVYTYDYADANNCPSEDVLNLTINNSTLNVMSAVECNSYTWTASDNTVAGTFTTSGAYEYTYTDANGCTVTDSLYLTIGTGRAFGIERVTVCGPFTWIVEGEEIAVLDESVETSTSVINPATGCDSTIFLYLTVNPMNVTNVTICDNESYTWTVNNETYTETGTYDVSENDNNGNCVSSDRLVLTVNQTKTTALTDQICLGNGYNNNGFVISAAEMSAAGEYTFTDTLSTVNGCDSVVTLTITVGDVINNPIEATACDTYTWTAGDNNEYTFTESGVYNSEAYANAAGCTTVDVLTLTINQNAGTEYTETVCDGYMWNGTQYTESGDYTYSYTDGNGCASTDVLHLTVNNSIVNTIEETVCDSYTWTSGNGETYTTSGVYTYNYTTADGCNGTDYLVLTVNHKTVNEYNVTACDSYFWDIDGQTYTESGNYTFDYENASGCPSVDVLHLTVNTSTNSNSDVTVCDSYTWNGAVYTESGDYAYEYINAKGCPSTDSLHLTVNHNSNSGEQAIACNVYNWHGVNYSQSGTYYHHYNTAEGCASVDTLFLTVNVETTSLETVTACDSYTWPANGETYTISGSYTARFQSANGCDSTITLQLTINNGQHNAETVVACDSYTWNGTAYTTSGIYPYNYTDNNGCASTDSLILTINNSTTGTETAEACNFFVWNGQAYTQSGNYTQTLEAANGCDSVVTLNLTINTQVTNTVNATACGSYTWNGAVYTQTGSYTQNFSSAAGCDSVVTLNLTISPAITNTVNTTVCDSYTWNGVTYTTSGIYSYTYTAANGCDSIVNLALTVNQPKTSTLAVTACGNYIWNGTTYTTSGNYTHTTPAANGCDSIVTLALTINQPVATTISETTCDSYTWNGATYTTSGNYTHTYTAANGCDSVVTLNLTISPAVTSTISATACGSYTWEGVTYTTSGSYTHTYTAANGCDSIVTLNLTIAPSIFNTLMETACDSYTWNGNTYLTSGTYTHTYTTDLGCDSIVTLVLTVTNSIVNNIAETACDSYSWNGNTYTASGVFTETYTSVNGCDSIVTLNLTVNQSNTGTDVKSACDNYTWIDGVTYTTSTDIPTFTLINAAGCDSIVTLDLTINHATSGIDVQQACDGYIWINGVNYTQSTNEPTFTLTNANGCDSVVTLNLTINQSIEIFDTITVNSTDLPYNYRGNEIMAAGDYIFYASTVNGCDSTVNLHVNVNQIGIDVVSFDEITVYPNPTRGRVTISADDVVKVEVLDVVGRRVATFEGTNTFDISNLGEGAYTLRITLPQGVTVRKVVKK